MAGGHGNIDHLMAKNLMKKYGPATRTNPGIEPRHSMMMDPSSRAFQEHIRTKYGFPQGQKPPLPGGLGAASLLAALSPYLREKAMGAVGLNYEGLENQPPEFPHHAVGSSMESSYYNE